MSEPSNAKDPIERGGGEHDSPIEINSPEDLNPNLDSEASDSLESETNESLDSSEGEPLQSEANESPESNASNSLDPSQSEPLDSRMQEVVTSSTPHNGETVANTDDQSNSRSSSDVSESQVVTSTAGMSALSNNSGSAQGDHSSPSNIVSEGETSNTQSSATADLDTASSADETSGSAANSKVGGEETDNSTTDSNDETTSTTSPTADVETSGSAAGEENTEAALTVETSEETPTEATGKKTKVKKKKAAKVPSEPTPERYKKAIYALLVLGMLLSFTTMFFSFNLRPISPDEVSVIYTYALVFFEASIALLVLYYYRHRFPGLLHAVAISGTVLVTGCVFVVNVLTSPSDYSHVVGDVGGLGRLGFGDTVVAGIGTVGFAFLVMATALWLYDAFAHTKTQFKLHLLRLPRLAPKADGSKNTGAKVLAFTSAVLAHTLRLFVIVALISFFFTSPLNAVEFISIAGWVILPFLFYVLPMFFGFKSAIGRESWSWLVLIMLSFIVPNMPSIAAALEMFAFKVLTLATMLAAFAYRDELVASFTNTQRDEAGEQPIAPPEHGKFMKALLRIGVVCFRLCAIGVCLAPYIIGMDSSISFLFYTYPVVRLSLVAVLIAMLLVENIIPSAQVLTLSVLTAVLTVLLFLFDSGFGLVLVAAFNMLTTLLEAQHPTWYAPSNRMLKPKALFQLAPPATRYTYLAADVLGFVLMLGMTIAPIIIGVLGITSPTEELFIPIMMPITIGIMFAYMFFQEVLWREIALWFLLIVYGPSCVALAMWSPADPTLFVTVAVFALRNALAIPGLIGSFAEMPFLTKTEIASGHVPIAN